MCSALAPMDWVGSTRAGNPSGSRVKAASRIPRPISMSVERGRWGPCCSTAASGRTATGSSRTRASTSALVSSSQMGSRTSRTPAPTGPPGAVRADIVGQELRGRASSPVRRAIAGTSTGSAVWVPRAHPDQDFAPDVPAREGEGCSVPARERRPPPGGVPGARPSAFRYRGRTAGQTGPSPDACPQPLRSGRQPAPYPKARARRTPLPHT